MVFWKMVACLSLRLAHSYATGDVEHYVRSDGDFLANENVSTAATGFVGSFSLNESLANRLLLENGIQMQNVSPIPGITNVTDADGSAGMSMTTHRFVVSQSLHPSVADAVGPDESPMRRLSREMVHSRASVSSVAIGDRRDRSIRYQEESNPEIGRPAGQQPALSPTTARWPRESKIRLLCLGLTLAILMTITCHMMPQVHQNSVRLPPRWEPGLEDSLPFRTWLQDLLLWTITSDLEPHRQAPMIIGH